MLTMGRRKSVGLLDFSLIEGRAAWIRKRSGLSGGDPPYSTSAITETAFPDVVVTGAELPNGITEMVVRDKGRIQLYYSRRVNAPSQRLGIVHGCYHLLTDLQESDGIRECNLSDRKFRQVNAIHNPVELACDLFAGALLVPFEVLDKLAPRALFPKDPVDRHVFDDECDRLASKFAVPVGFIRWRLYDLLHLRKTNFNA